MFKTDNNWQSLEPQKGGAPHSGPDGEAPHQKE